MNPDQLQNTTFNQLFGQNSYSKLDPNQLLLMYRKRTKEEYIPQNYTILSHKGNN